jgi:hypothetical protein
VLWDGIAIRPEGLQNRPTRQSKMDGPLAKSCSEAAALASVMTAMSPRHPTPPSPDVLAAWVKDARRRTLD